MKPGRASEPQSVIPPSSHFPKCYFLGTPPFVQPTLGSNFSPSKQPSKVIYPPSYTHYRPDILKA